jgi:broad specificity phosphatase PhoE
MSLYIVTIEDENGMWEGEPLSAESEAQARDLAKTLVLPPPKGHAYVLYRCSQVETLAESD